MALGQQRLSKYDREIAKGDVHYNSFVYMKAIEYYKKALIISDQNPDYPSLRIADSYRLVNDNDNALAWYNKVAHKEVMTVTDKVNYAQILILNGQYDKAKAVADSIGTNLERLDRAHLSSSISVDTATYFIRNLEVNSAESDFSPAFYQKGIVFVSNREYSNLFQSKYYWDESYFLDLYYSQNVDSTEESFSRFHKRINTIYHEGPSAFYDNDNKIIFTRNNFNQGRKTLSDEGINKLMLFYSERESKDHKWSKAVELPFNNDNYSVGHPSITSDGKRLYFASDMPGTLGEADIYYADWQDGAWTTPVNLGAKVNTPAEEMFPFIYQDSILYYASKGLLGLGGLDIYKVNLNDPMAKPVNMGAPMNSPFDDFGLIREGSTGYFSSNRKGGKGKDDIYFYRITPSYIIAVKAVDKETGVRILSANIEMLNSRDQELVELNWNPDSTMVFRTLENNSYAATAKHPSYYANQIAVKIGENLNVDTLFFEIPMERIVINRPIVLQNIYYNFDRAGIRNDASPVLDSLIQVLVDNPDIKIELSAHTDARGGKRYNERLSQRRADSAIKYMMARGIAAERLTAKGYGETMPVNECVDGVWCHPDRHQKNRRTEFKVTESGEALEIIYKD